MANHQRRKNTEQQMKDMRMLIFNGVDIEEIPDQLLHRHIDGLIAGYKDWVDSGKPSPLSTNQLQIIETLKNNGVYISVPDTILAKNFDKVIIPFYEWNRKWMLVHPGGGIKANMLCTKDDIIIGIRVKSLSKIRLIIPKTLKNIEFAYDETQISYSLSLETLDSIYDQYGQLVIVELANSGVLEPTEKVCIQLENLLLDRVRKVIRARNRENKLEAWRISLAYRLPYILELRSKLYDRIDLLPRIIDLGTTENSISTRVMEELNELLKIKGRYAANRQEIEDRWKEDGVTQQEFINFLRLAEKIQEKLNQHRDGRKGQRVS